MNTDELKKSAEEAKQAATDFVKSPQVQEAISKGKDVLEKGKNAATEFVNSPKVQDAIKKGKDSLEDAVDKLKGIF